MREINSPRKTRKMTIPLRRALPTTRRRNIPQQRPALLRPNARARSRRTLSPRRRQRPLSNPVPPLPALHIRHTRHGRRSRVPKRPAGAVIAPAVLAPRAREVRSWRGPADLRRRVRASGVHTLCRAHVPPRRAHASHASHSTHTTHTTHTVHAVHRWRRKTQTHLTQCIHVHREATVIRPEPTR